MASHVLPAVHLCRKRALCLAASRNGVSALLANWSSMQAGAWRGSVAMAPAGWMDDNTGGDVDDVANDR